MRGGQVSQPSVAGPNMHGSALAAEAQFRAATRRRRRQITTC